jgi:hypothetical protein
MSETGPERRARQARDKRAIALREFEAVAKHAEQQLALYRRRIYLGRGEPRRLAELERESDGANGRLRRARDAAEQPPAAPGAPS